MATVALARKTDGKTISVIHTADLENGAVIGYKGISTKVFGEETRMVQVLADGEPFAILLCDCHRYNENETEADFVLKKDTVGRAYIPERGDVFEIAESYIDAIETAKQDDLLELKVGEMKFAKKDAGTAVARLRRKGLKNIPNQTSAEIEIL